MYYIILIVYYTLGTIFFITSDVITTTRNKELNNIELLEELL
jgi:hypothetical protein